MPKRRRLNGLPNALVQRYFSTLFYWDGGYMADWIWKIASEKNVSAFEMDILNENITPPELLIKPLVGHFVRLRETIAITLAKNNFPEGTIVKAKLIVGISDKFKSLHMIECRCEITDVEGRRYIGKLYHERAYEMPYQAPKLSVFKKIRRLFLKRLA